MRDILPPAPVHGGLTGLVEQSGLPPSLLLGLAALLLALSALAWITRRRLSARLRLAQARRALLAGRADEVERLIRRHHDLAHLHPAKPPLGADAACWRAVVEGLHQARFGMSPATPEALSPLIARVFPPRPAWARRKPTP